MDFKDFFASATGTASRAGRHRFDYQERLALEPWPDLLSIPTGLGKTAAVVLAWAWKRGWRPHGQRVAPDAETPRRLVYCLPMRVLVEQTQRECAQWMTQLGVFGLAGQDRVVVHVLMGGSEDLRKPVWAEHPEQDQIIIGTQDMLLSRALMRGYGMSRYQWPVHFAMLHSDAMWVYDEVQLMGPGLVTSVQLDAFRRALGGAVNSRSLWVSATLNREWMKTVDFDPASLTPLELSEAEKLTEAVSERRESIKPLEQGTTPWTAEGKSALSAYLENLARQVVAGHCQGTTTLVILNTVERAQQLREQLAKHFNPRVKTTKRSEPAPSDHASVMAPEIILIHSRFRPQERAQQSAKLTASIRPDGPGRIIIATQAIEAGVDLSARLLFTEIAPYASMVQRFGRCNRYGEFNSTGEARVIWLDVADPKPYAAMDLQFTRDQLANLTSVAPADLPEVNAAAALHPVLRRKDFLDLFSTEADLSGFDVDIAPYIRDTDDADIFLFWRAWATPIEAAGQHPAKRDELCRAGLGAAKKLLKDLKRGDVQIWDTLAREWTQPAPQEIRLRPGMTLMIHAEVGGYTDEAGLEPNSRKAVTPAIKKGSETDDVEAIDDEHRSLQRFAVTLPRHLADVEQEARTLCAMLLIDAELTEAVIRAARWHDIGKAHEAFDSMLRTAHRQGTGQDLAPGFWAKSGCDVDPTTGSLRKTDRARYTVLATGKATQRKHFRHELASALTWLNQCGDDPQPDLIAFLIAAHHGKVRMSLRALPNETEPPDTRLFARGVWAGDVLPEVTFEDGQTVPRTTLQLDLMQLGEGSQGPSWTTRTQGLLKEHGPFRLAWLESLVRIADWRATRAEQERAAKQSKEGAGRHG